MNTEKYRLKLSKAIKKSKHKDDWDLIFIIIEYKSILKKHENDFNQINCQWYEKNGHLPNDFIKLKVAFKNKLITEDEYLLVMSYQCAVDQLLIDSTVLWWVNWYIENNIDPREVKRQKEIQKRYKRYKEYLNNKPVFRWDCPTICGAFGISFIMIILIIGVITKALNTIS